MSTRAIAEAVRAARATRIDIDGRDPFHSFVRNEAYSNGGKRTFVEHVPCEMCAGNVKLCIRFVRSGDHVISADGLQLAGVVINREQREAGPLCSPDCLTLALTMADLDQNMRVIRLVPHSRAGGYMVLDRGNGLRPVEYGVR